jgi:hypothetical protein
MLFKEIISVYSENHTKPLNAKHIINDCYGNWDTELKAGFRGLKRMFIFYYRKVTSEEST